MIRKRSGALVLALLGVFGLGTAGVLYAQVQERGGMMGMMSMMQNCPMMRAAAEGPDGALEHRDELGLSSAQVESLEAIQERTNEGRRAAMERMAQLHEEISAATEGERFDEPAVRAAFDRMGSLHTEMGVAMLRTRHEVRQVLTAEQLERLSELAGGMMNMHGMMQMMGGMDMQHCPMMQGGMMRGMEGMQMHRPPQDSTQGR